MRRNVKSRHGHAWLRRAVTKLPVRCRATESGTSEQPPGISQVIKYNHLVADLVIFHNRHTMTLALKELEAEGWKLTPELLAAFGPLRTHHLNRFGLYEIKDGVPPVDYGIGFDIRDDDAAQPAVLISHESLPWALSGKSRSMKESCLSCFDGRTVGRRNVHVVLVARAQVGLSRYGAEVTQRFGVLPGPVVDFLASGELVAASRRASMRKGSIRYWKVQLRHQSAAEPRRERTANDYR